MRLAAVGAALAVACSSGSKPAEPPKPPPDAEAAPADAGAPPDAGPDLAEVRQVAFADVIKQSYPGAQRCWEKAAADDFRVAGTVTLAIRFGAGGRLARVDVVGDGTGDGVLTACLVQLFTDAAWPPVFEPDTAIEFPFQFEQPAGQYTVRREDVADGRLLHPNNTGNPAFELVLTSDVKLRTTRTQALFAPATATFALLRPNTIPPKPAEWLLLSVPRTGTPPRRSAAKVLSETFAQELPIAGGRGAVRFGFVDPAVYVGTISLQAGVEVPEHDHPGSTEVLYVLEGQGTMTVAGKKYPVVPNMAIQIPPGVKHAFSAGSAVRAVQFYTPAGPEQRFKAPPP